MARAKYWNPTAGPDGTGDWVYADSSPMTPVDSTLAKPGWAADAKATGVKIQENLDQITANDQKQTEAQTQLDTKINTHADNANIHVTVEDKSKWNKKVSLPDSGNGMVGQAALSDGKGGVTWGNLDVYEFKDPNSDGNIVISIKK